MPNFSDIQAAVELGANLETPSPESLPALSTPSTGGKRIVSHGLASVPSFDDVQVVPFSLSTPPQRRKEVSDSGSENGSTRSHDSVSSQKRRELLAKRAELAGTQAALQL